MSTEDEKAEAASVLRGAGPARRAEPTAWERLGKPTPYQWSIRERLGWIVAGVWVLAGGVIANLIAVIVIAANNAPAPY